MSDSGAGSRTASTQRTKASNTALFVKIAAWFFGIAGSIIPIAIIVGAISFLVIYQGVKVPAPDSIQLSQKAYIYDSTGRGVLAQIVPDEGNRTDVKIADVPEVVKNAVIAAEDRDFLTNKGFSLKGVSRAAWGQITSRDGAGGGSTITQQYVKNAVVGDSYSLKRKVKELAISIKMSHDWTKDQILEAYLNTIYFGRGAYGIAAASQAYFGKSFKKLNTAEAALLAGIIRVPSVYDPAVDLKDSQRRFAYVVNGLVQIGAITRAEAAKTQFPPNNKQYRLLYHPAENNANTTRGPNGLIRNQVLKELTSLGISEDEQRTGGLRIYTTIDPQVQRSLVSAANDKLQGEPGELRAAAVSIDPRTGAIKGYFGGNDGQGYDYANAGLQTGSSFKVFALVAALEQGIPMSTTLSSAPYQPANGPLVTNSDGESCGSCNLATAMKMSLNTVYYRLMMEYLKNKAVDVESAAHRAGIPECLDPVGGCGDQPKTLQEANGVPEGGVVLGQYQSRPIDMASAYATLANSGVYNNPHFITKVTNSDGDVLYEYKPKPQRRIDKAVADNVTAALTPVAAYSRGHALDYGSRPSASKTGTAQLGDTGYNKDAWMVGYTPQLSTAVWVGTNKGTPLKNYAGSNIYGSGLPSDIWQAAMDAALENDDIEQFPTPTPIGGVAGIPPEPEPVYTDTPESTGPSSTEDKPDRTTTKKPDKPTNGNDGDGGNGIEILPGITVPAPRGNR